MACNLPRLSNPWLSVLILVMGAINIGFGMVYPSYTTTSIGDKFGWGKTERIWFNAAGTFSAIFTSLGVNYFVLKYGKRWTGFWSGVFGTVMWVLLGVSVNTPMVFVFRILSCSSIGLHTTIIPSFIAEVAPLKYKYLFGYANQIGIALGFLFVTIMGAYLSWQSVAFICAVPNAILFLGILFVPEKESHAEGEAGDEEKLDDDKVETERDNEFLATCKMSKEMFVAFLLMFFLQFCGITSVMSNMETMLSSAKLSISNRLVGILALVVQFISTIVASTIVDRWGKFTCWTLSAILQLIAFILMCVHQLKNLNSSVFIVGLFLEQFGYGIGNGPIPFAVCATLFPPELSSTAMAYATAENWVLTGGVCLVWPYLEQALTLGYTFLFFAGIMVLELIFGFTVLRSPKQTDSTIIDPDQIQELPEL